MTHSIVVSMNQSLQHQDKTLAHLHHAVQIQSAENIMVKLLALVSQVILELHQIVNLNVIPLMNAPVI